jgi:hypothetical protein
VQSSEKAPGRPNATGRLHLGKPIAMAASQKNETPDFL